MMYMNFIGKGKVLLESLIKTRKLDMGFALAGLLMGIFFGWSILEIFIFVIFIWSIIGPIRSQYLAWMAAFFLLLTAILLAFGEKEWAEEFSISVYYLLVMTVVRGIIEARKDEKNEYAGNKP